MKRPFEEATRNPAAVPHRTGTAESDGSYEFKSSVQREGKRRPTPFVHDQLSCIAPGKYVFVPFNLKECALAYLSTLLPTNGSMIVFAETAATAEATTRILTELDVPAATLLPGQTKTQRIQSEHHVTVFCTTDEASSLFLDKASSLFLHTAATADLVVSYDVPSSKDLHLKRISRAAHSGQALTFVSQFDVEVYKRLELELEEFELEKKSVKALLQTVSRSKENMNKQVD